MSFFKTKKGKNVTVIDINLDGNNTAIQKTPPTDPIKLFWIDTSVEVAK